MMFQSFYPVIITDKLGEARQFYEQHFGFQAVFATDWYVQLHASRAGGAPPLELALMAPDLDTQPQVLHPALMGLASF